MSQYVEDIGRAKKKNLKETKRIMTYQVENINTEVKIIKRKQIQNVVLKKHNNLTQTFTRRVQQHSSPGKRKDQWT